MKKIGLVLFMMLFGTIIADSTLAQGNNTGLVSETLDGFETPDSWDIKFSSQRCPKWTTEYLEMDSEENSSAAENPDQTQTANPSQTDGQGETWIKWFNIDNFPAEKKSSIMPNGIPKSDKEKEKTILGIKGCWNSRGFNWVAIEPKKPIYTNTDPLALSIWVWGTNYNYDLYVTVKNEKGFYYNFYVGTLNYFGWRQLKINIPGYVFPKNAHLAKNKLEIVRFKIVGNLAEDYSGFYAYFDLLQVLHGNKYTSYTGNALSENRW